MGNPQTTGSIFSGKKELAGVGDRTVVGLRLRARGAEWDGFNAGGGMIQKSPGH